MSTGLIVIIVCTVIILFCIVVCIVAVIWAKWKKKKDVSSDQSNLIPSNGAPAEK
jgi:cell division protein FtsL